MKPLLPICLLLLFTVWASAALAVSIHKCVDAQGNVTYQEFCPPGAKSVEERDYRVGTSAGAGNTGSSDPLTLYIVPECDSCEQVKEFLALRGISVAERNVNDDIDLQNELKEVAGDLRVPALVVGDNVIVGYDRTALLDSLSQAGYPTEANVE